MTDLDADHDADLDGRAQLVGLVAAGVSGAFVGFAVGLTLAPTC